MSSKTKEIILQRYRENLLLNASSPSPMVHDDSDASADELFAPLDERIIASTAEALESGQTHYVDVPGIAPLRDALAGYLSAATGADFQRGNVLVTAGMQEGRFLTVQMIGQQNQPVAVPRILHPGIRRALGVRPLQMTEIPVQADSGLPSVDAIGAALDAGAKLLVLESPSRLTGAIYTADEVERIAELVRSHEAAVIWDQGLSPWVVGQAYRSLAAPAGMVDRAAVIGEAYPGMGLASWYAGYIAAPPGWIAPMQSQKQIMAICTSTPTQYAALEAGKLFAEAHPHQLDRLRQKREALAARATQAGLEVINGSTATVLALRLPARTVDTGFLTLLDSGSAIANGADFGAAGLLRLTVSAGSAADTALDLLTAKKG